MIDIQLSGRTRNCEGASRRDVLRVGALSVLGLSLPDLLRLREAAAAPGRPQAASCIFLFLDGGPSHHETFDPKPDAPAEIRGEFGLIETSIPGVRFSEYLPQTARIANQCAFIRSMHHHDSGHGGAMHYLQTGLPTPNPVGDGEAVSFHPSYGSVVARERPAGTLPTYVEISIPVPVRSGGPNFLGSACAPFRVGTNPSDPNFMVRDVNPPGGLDGARLEARRALLKQVDRLQRLRDRAAEDPVRGVDAFREKAEALVTSSRAKEAFIIQREPDALRDRYGRSAVGQGCLLARRLVEAGVPWITVLHSGWDHHGQIFSSLKTRWLPIFDRAFSTLVADLEDRGLLASTLVIATGEFGRTPKINENAGRDHWPGAMSVALAGAGVPRGSVIGATDIHGAAPSDRPLKPEDLAASLYAKLGVDPRKEYHTPLGRPVPIVNNGEIIRELY